MLVGIYIDTSITEVCRPTWADSALILLVTYRRDPKEKPRDKSNFRTRRRFIGFQLETSKTFERRPVTDQHPVDHFNLIYDHDTQPGAPSSLSRRRAAFPSLARKDAERARGRLLTQLEPTSKRVGKNRLDTYSTLAVNIFNNSNFLSLCAFQNNLTFIAPAVHVPVQASQERPGTVA
jgi:hypothetical protein